MIFLFASLATMKEYPLQLKKYLTILHIGTGVLAFLSILFYFFISKEYPLIYQVCLLSYLLSGTLILALYFKTLGNFERWYLELLFIAPILVVTFLMVTRLFDHLLFG